MALTPQGLHPRIGESAATEAEARAAFDRQFQQFRALIAQAKEADL